MTNNCQTAWQLIFWHSAVSNQKKTYKKTSWLLSKVSFRHTLALAEPKKSSGKNEFCLCIGTSLKKLIINVAASWQHDRFPLCACKTINIQLQISIWGESLYLQMLFSAERINAKNECYCNLWVFKKQRLQGASLFNPLFPKAHNSECQNLAFPVQIQQWNVNLKLTH